MSISICQYCETPYDQDVNVEHEDICRDEREEAEKENMIWNARRLLEKEGYKVTK